MNEQRMSNIEYKWKKWANKVINQLPSSPIPNDQIANDPIPNDQIANDPIANDQIANGYVHFLVILVLEIFLYIKTWWLNSGIHQPRWRSGYVIG